MQAVRRPWITGALVGSWLAVSLLGCDEAMPARAGAPGRGVTVSTFDAQACLENALRRDPDRSTVAAARVAFEKACNEGRGVACSALGVMNEVGVGVPPDLSRAIALYDRACRYGNVHGCTNLAVVRIDGIGGEPLPSSSLRTARERRFEARILEASCDRGDARACLVLARLHDAERTEWDKGLAARLFEAACEGEEVSACMARAESLASAGHGDAASTFYAKACSLGDARGCAYDGPHAVSLRDPMHE